MLESCDMVREALGNASPARERQAMPLHPAVVALIYSLLGVLFIGIGLPMARGRVKPNAWYGFRTPKTFSSPEIWYAANRVGGIDLIIGGCAIIAVAIALFLIRTYVAPELRSDLYTVVAFIAIMVVVAAHSFWALGRM
jgi:uncharacterized membrane protein